MTYQMDGKWRMGTGYRIREVNEFLVAQVLQLREGLGTVIIHLSI